MSMLPRDFPADAPKVVLMTGPFGEPERVFALDQPMTIAEVVETKQLAFRLPTIAVMEGEPVLRGGWNVRVVRPGDVLAFIAVPGRSGSSGKQIIGLIATLALTIAAPFVGGAIAGVLGISANIASAAFLVGGSLLLSALMPKATKPDMGQGETVYSANAATNSATPLDVIPTLYGTLRYPPRFAARPYAEYAGNDQFLYQLFCVTAGDADVTQINIGETKAWDETGGYSPTFSDITFEIVKPGGTVTLFPANVVTSTEVSGQQVPNPPDVLGPYVVNSAGTTVNRLAVDFAFPAGLYNTDDEGKIKKRSVTLRADYRTVDATGAPVGTWTQLFRKTFSFATRTQQRITQAKDVPAGRYEVRFVSESTFANANSNNVDRVFWVGLRGYLTDFVTPPGCTLLAMRAKANEQLTQASSQQINVTATRRLQAFNGYTWQPLARTSAIAWAVADLLRNTDYGLGLTDSQYDLLRLVTLNTTWAARGDTFNAIFDRKWTADDALGAMLRVGRAQRVRIGGKIGFVRDEPKQIKRAVFTNRNIVRGSFSNRIILFDEEKPDHVIGKYLDGTVWKEREVVASLAAVGAEEPQTVEWFGITNHDQVWRESVTLAAENAYRRETVSFTAEWEGKLLVRGDPVLVQHPFIEGIANAALVARDGVTLTVDRDLDVPELDGYVILRDKAGREWGPCKIASMSGPRTIALDPGDLADVEADMGALDGLLPGPREEPAHLLLCEGETRPFNALVVSATPRGAHRVDIETVIDAPEVYAADHTEVMPSPWTPPNLPPPLSAAPIVQGLYLSARTAVAGIELDAIWTPAAGAASYLAEVSYDDGETWTPIWNGTNNRFTASILPQPLMLRVAGVGAVRGGWTVAALGSTDIPDRLMTPGVVKNDALSDDLSALMQQIQSRVPDDITTLRKDLEELASAINAQTASIREGIGRINLAVGARFGESLAGVEIAQLAAAGANSALAALFVDLFAVSESGEASGKIRFVAASAPEGVASSFAIETRASIDQDFAKAGLYLDAGVTALGGISRIRLVADQIVLSNSDGSTTFDALLLAVADVPQVVKINDGVIRADFTSRRTIYETLMTGGATMRFPHGAKPGFQWTHLIRQDGNGGHDLAFVADEVFGAPPILGAFPRLLSVVDGLVVSTTPPKMLLSLRREAFEDPAFYFTGSWTSAARTFRPVGDAGGQSGELMVVITYASGQVASESNPAPVVTTPPGWELAVSARGKKTTSNTFVNTTYNTVGHVAAIHYRRLDGTETASISTLSAGTGASFSQTVLRFMGGATLTVHGKNEVYVQGTPAPQNLNASELSAPVLVLGFSSTGFSTFSPAAEQVIGGRVGFKTYSADPQNHTIASPGANQAILLSCMIKG